MEWCQNAHLVRAINKTDCGIYRSALRPPLSKKSFPVGRVGEKNCQSRGRDFFFFPNLNFSKTRMYREKGKKKN